MNKPAVSKGRKFLDIVLSVLIVLAGLLLMAACLSIYRSGDQPFSRESVAAVFAQISDSIYICLAVIAGTLVLDFLSPPERKTPPQRQTAMILQRMQEKTDIGLCPDALRRSILAQRAGRRKMTRISLVLLLLCSLIFLSYGANPTNFHQTQINDSMIRAMYWLAPCCLIPFGFGIFAAYKSKASMEAEIDLLKTAPREAKAAPAAAAKKKALPVSSVLLVIAIVILVYGFCNGGTADVLTKAVNICTECVGLG